MRTLRRISVAVASPLVAVCLAMGLYGAMLIEGGTDELPNPLERMR